MNGWRLLGRRLLQVLPVLGLLLVVVFALEGLLPGDTARAFAGPRATEARVAQVRAELGLDQPVTTRFSTYIGHLARGDLGESNRSDIPVTQLIGERAGVTLSLLSGGLIAGVLIAGPAALVLARRPRSRLAWMLDRILSVAINLPSFWVGLTLATVIGLRLGALPVGGLAPGFAGHLRSYVLPSVTIGISLAPFMARSAATSLRDVLAADHVVTARSVGASGSFLFRRHMLRNALPPTVTLLGFQAGALLFGTVVVEQTFALPGLGAAMITAAAQRDFPVVQGLTLLFGLGIILFNLLSDLAVAMLDPRTRWA
ncbi:ABC transporter permease [Amycolatopsis pithecellobii]|uniref:ABC transporter permease subunit n=1 Tax=Amycolatopsis pithecellobii TaxID=664692 RepID=A0A6N7YY07_9PSEU|nr:ABC transporter permease [Amycolatopsis pithecellobii]MTD57975.1 ABC transporter permease subunit [Amycolatopsis pithecellobii]